MSVEDTNCDDQGSLNSVLHDFVLSESSSDMTCPATEYPKTCIAKTWRKSTSLSDGNSHFIFGKHEE